MRTYAISRTPQHGRDLSSGSKSRQGDLLVAPARDDRKQTHSNPSWLDRYDAAVLQGFDELGQVREQRSCQCLRPPATLAAKLNDRRLSRRSHREERSEISIRRHDVPARSKITSSSACCNPIERTWIAS